MRWARGASSSSWPGSDPPFPSWRRPRCQQTKRSWRTSSRFELLVLIVPKLNCHLHGSIADELDFPDRHPFCWNGLWFTIQIDLAIIPLSIDKLGLFKELQKVNGHAFCISASKVHWLYSTVGDSLNREPNYDDTFLFFLVLYVAKFLISHYKKLKFLFLILTNLVRVT